MKLSDISVGDTVFLLNHSDFPLIVEGSLKAQNGLMYSIPSDLVYVNWIDRNGVPRECKYRPEQLTK